MRPARTTVNAVKLLWTGGWDSTFRLLQLLLLDRTVVQPYYLIDAGRPSTGMEIRAMSNLKDRLFGQYPGTRDLLHPTRYTEVADIEPDAEITEAFRGLAEDKFIGSQYDWLARFCKQEGIADMELCIHRDDKAHAILTPFLHENPMVNHTLCPTVSGKASEPEYTLFRYFRFPLLGLSKVEMAALSREQHWTVLMNITWFCHRPKRGKPCGMCNPCLYTLAEGLGHRIPAGRRALSRLQRTTIRPLRQAAKAIRKQLIRRS
jgi:hypothetical protein